MVQETRPVVKAQVQGKKADGSFEDVKTNDAGALEVHDSSLASQLLSMDFWSNPLEEVAVTAAQVTTVLSTVIVADLPVGATVVRAIAMFKFRMVENTNAAENSLDCTAVQPIQVDDSGGTGYVTAIDLQDKIAATTREGGDVIIGDNDIAARVDGNDTDNNVAALSGSGSNFDLQDRMLSWM